MTESRRRAHERESAEGPFEVVIDQNVRIPASTPGVTLAADAYRPRTDRPVPAVVTLHTVRRDAIGGMSIRRHMRIFASRGYAALLVDCRGTGTSTGTELPLVHPAELDDGVAVVEWLAAQPWCTGSVGMWGLSAGGMTTLGTASKRPPALKAIIPMMGFVDGERDLVHPSGLPGGLGYVGRICLHELLLALLPPLRSEDIHDETESWRARLDEFEPWVMDMWRTPPGHPVWDSRRVDTAQIQVPTFCVLGWRDFLCDAMARSYEQVDAPKRLLAGPWLHAFPEASAEEPVPFVDLACEWWARWLHNDDPENSRGEQHADVYVQGKNGRWTSFPEWPPRDVVTRTYFPTYDGGLEEATGTPGSTARRPGNEATRFSIHQTDPTVGMLGGLWTQPIARIGYPLDQHDDDVRSLSFTSNRLPTDLRVAGRVGVELAVSSTSTVDRCVAKLCDVDESGRSIVITTGAVTVPNHGRSGGRPNTVGVVMSLDVTCYEIAAGHRLRLTLSDSDFPRFWPAPERGKLVVRVLDSSVADAEGVSSQDWTGSISALTVPCLATGELPPPMVSAAPKKNKVARQQQFPPDSWKTSRDHLLGTVSVEVDQTDGGFYDLGRCRIFRIDRSLSAAVNASAPEDAVMTATGRCLADTEHDEHVIVDANIEMRTHGLSVEGRVTVNGVEEFRKKWSTY